MNKLHNYFFVGAPFAFVLLVFALATTVTNFSELKTPAAVVFSSNLGQSTSFAVFSPSGIINKGATTIAGNIGTYPNAVQIGFNANPDHIVLVRGAVHTPDTLTSQAARDINSLSQILSHESPVISLPSALSGTLKPGAYESANAKFTLDGVLTLDGEGDPNATFILKTQSDLTLAKGSKVILKNAAQACNVFWLIGGNTILGADSSVVGTVISALNTKLESGARVEGNIYAQKGTISLNSNTIIDCKAR